MFPAMDEAQVGDPWSKASPGQKHAYKQPKRSFFSFLYKIGEQEGIFHFSVFTLYSDENEFIKGLYFYFLVLGFGGQDGDCMCGQCGHMEAPFTMMSTDQDRISIGKVFTWDIRL